MRSCGWSFAHQTGPRSRQGSCTSSDARSDAPTSPCASFHDSLGRHWHEIIALAEHRPPTGRIEALNNNWETLVRRGRGYRDHQHLFRKLRFMVANPVRTDDGVKRFLALGLPTPHRRAS
ncbi:MAG: transposase [Polyangiaceae bacterium]|nr:transposase [Polyangiaceae bacterium]